jgi:hypothetical protein
MAARVKFPVINERIIFDGSGIFGPQARAEFFANSAKHDIDLIDRENAAAAGHNLQYRTFVDGRETVNLREAKETSIIVARWDLGAGVVAYIWDLLHKAGPAKTGKYRKSARMHADGVEITDPDEAIGAHEVMFVSVVPYARKIEFGKGRYSPGHVYEAVTAMANARFSNIAKIKFTFAAPAGPAPELSAWAARNASLEGHPHKRGKKMDKNMRNPAILVFLT